MSEALILLYIISESIRRYNMILKIVVGTHGYLLLKKKFKR
jgi:hypothetical protein